MRSCRPAVLAAVAGLAMSLYIYLKPPLAKLAPILRLPWIENLPGDLPAYALRFLCSFLLLGLLPLITALALGERPADLGLRLPRALRPRWLTPLLAALILAGVLLGAHNPELSTFYPFSRTLTRAGRGWGFLLHSLLYVLLYYLPWELLFRGILLFPFVRLFDERFPDRAWSGGWSVPMTFVVLQAIPAALLHFGHPFLETLAALPFGIAAGWLALRTGSILPGLALHALAGIGQDLFNTLRALGAMP